MFARMQGPSFSRPLSKGLTLIFIFSLSGCASWFSGRKTISNKEDGRKELSRTVSREEYNQLLARYESLLKEFKEQNKSSSPTKRGEESMLLRDLKAAKKMAPKAKAPALGSTVEFSIDNRPKKTKNFGGMRPSLPISELDDQTVASELAKLSSAFNKLKERQGAEAISILQELEASPVAQVRVWAIFSLAEVYFRQKKFDLASQMYREITDKYAFSGLVIRSLGRLVVCAEKIGAKADQDRYYSLLNEFFES